MAGCTAAGRARQAGPLPGPPTPPPPPPPRAFPDAFTLRCFAFEPSDEQIQEDRRGVPNFIMFPPGDHEQLDNHAEVVMHDFAACLLAEVRRHCGGRRHPSSHACGCEPRVACRWRASAVCGPQPHAQLERWMLNASPAMVDLNTFVDAPEFTGAPSALETVQTRLYSDEARAKPRRCCMHACHACACLPTVHPSPPPQELRTKRRYCRLQKAMGDYSLLAGSPLDAQDHYSTGARERVVQSGH